MKKVLLIIAVVACTAAVSAGVHAAVSPAGKADPTFLNELQPGAVVSTQPDGSIAALGKATPAVQAEVELAAELADAGPNSVHCSGLGATVKCVPVADSAVIARLKRGDALYGRTVYRSITKRATDGAAPMFEEGELVCGEPGSDATMLCSRVDVVQPVIPAGERLFVTYKPYHVTFDEQGVPTTTSGRPTVRLVRAAS
jgi:hypothetical protein